MPAPYGLGCPALFKQKGTGVLAMLHSERVKVRMLRKARERENQGLRWEMGLSDPGMDMFLTVFIMRPTKDGPEILERWPS